MARLKFYQNEYKVYRDFWQVRYNQKDAIKICNKLNRHFKTGASFRFSNNTIGEAYWNGLIDLPKKNIALAMICHEVGHLLSRKKYGLSGRGHNKRLAKTNKTIFKYAIKYLPINTLLNINKQLLIEHKKGIH
jgi:hypothetical protein